MTKAAMMAAMSLRCSLPQHTLEVAAMTGWREAAAKAAAAPRLLLHLLMWTT
jgi:hypothetical protein